MSEQLPEYVKEAAERVLAAEWAIEAMEAAEGRTMWVDAENYHKLLEDATTLARHVRPNE